MTKKLLLLGILVTAILGGTSQAGPGWITTCQYSHSLTDDPIVFFGVPGASHLHDFAGAENTNAFSTFDSLRGSNTSCSMVGDTSAYWVPAASKNGVRILPNATSKNALLYYRRGSSGTIQPFPPGLKMIVGNGHAVSAADNKQLANGNIYFKCGPGSNTHLMSPPGQCSSGVMVISLTFPSCWDGVNLDSVDHISHVAYPPCTSSHPVPVPKIVSYWRYNVGTAPIGEIRFSSGPYFTIHQDFFNAWDPAELQKFVTNCLNNSVDCGVNPQ